MRKSKISGAAFAAILGSMSAAQAAGDDGYVMGAGRWTCDDVVRIAETGTGIEKGQLVGWLLGYWSAATFNRETGFVDTVESAGGEGIYNATVAQCRKANAGVPLYRVTREMIHNTK